MLTITYQTRVRAGWDHKETIENLTTEEAQKYIQEYQSLLQKRTGVPNKLRLQAHLYEITKIGDRCITGWSGTLSEQHKAGFNVDRKSEYLFN